MHFVPVRRSSSFTLTTVWLVPEFKRIQESGEFENDWYFVSQLYDVNWRPKFTV